MANIQLEFPTIIAQEIPDVSQQGPFNPLAPKGVPVAKNMIADGVMFRGVVNKDGTWLVDPGGWTISKVSMGLFKVQHLLGWTNTSLSVSLLTQPGSAQIIEHNPVAFTVQCIVDGQPADLGFTFVLSRVLSLSA